MLSDGHLRPGDRLPSESELSTRIGVSRGSLRQAIRTFVALGVLETRRGSGNYITELRPADLIASLSLTMGLLPIAGALEITQIRRMLEAQTASLAAARIDRSTLRILADLICELETSTDPERQSELDHLFHMTITAAAGHDALTALLDVLRSRLRAHRISNADDAAEMKLHSDAGHRAILRALEAADPVAAATAATTHVAHTEYWVALYASAAAEDGFTR